MGRRHHVVTSSPSRPWHAEATVRVAQGVSRDWPPLMTPIDRLAEARRYRRLGRTADRLYRMGAGLRTYKGRHAHEWHSLANAVERHFLTDST